MLALTASTAALAQLVPVHKGLFFSGKGGRVGTGGAASRPAVRAPVACMGKEWR
jgi:hypothetical protein